MSIVQDQPTIHGKRDNHQGCRCQHPLCVGANIQLLRGKSLTVTVDALSMQAQ